MSFCPNCGSKINENVAFCGNCGKQINKYANKSKFHIDGRTININFDGKKILKSIKSYFLDFYTDYSSFLFKFAMLMFLAIGVGESLYPFIQRFLPQNLFNIFDGISEIYRLFVCIVLFGIFAIPIFIIKNKKQTLKKSNFLQIFWTVTIILNLLVFIAGINLYQYILYSYTVVPIVNLLLVVSSILLIYINKPKSPVVLFVSVLSFALTKCSIWQINFAILAYKINGNFSTFINIIASLGYILLVVVLFALVYFVPKKISKYLVYIPSLFIVVLVFVDLIESLSLNNIIRSIIDIFIVTSFTLLAISCTKEAKYEYVVKSNESTTKSVITVGVISLITAIVITVSLLLVSAIVCSNQINSGIEKWKDKIVTGELSTAEWSEVNKDIFKYSSTKLAKPFIDEYSFYDTLKDNRYTMQEITNCYIAYENENISDDIIEDYTNINIDESWENDIVLSSYYSKYLEMKPDIKNVFVNSRVDVDNGTITISVTNNNMMPISKCETNCKFTIGFIESGYSSGVEYGRGNKTLTIEDIPGNSSKTETFNFDADDYYDSYGSYIMAFLFEQSSTVSSIE